MQDEPNTLPEFVGSVPVVEDQALPIEITALTNNIARLESRLDTEREDRLEERFRWVCATAILFDVVAVVAVNGSWLFVLIFMLQLIAILGYAKACGVDWAEQLIGQLFHIIAERMKKGDDTPDDGA